MPTAAPRSLQRHRPAEAAPREAGMVAAPAASPALGNQDLQRLLGGLRVAPNTGAPEREAEQVAHQLGATHPAQAARQPALPRTPPQAGDAMAPASVGQALAQPGHALAPSARQGMEQRFGADFQHVRVHTGAAAERSAQELGAQAYTAGPHIVFSAGRYAPQTPQGEHLLAHELTHVLRQSATGSALVQRAIKPEDVAVEMIGREFELSAAFTSGPFTVAKGARVTAVTWVNTDTSVLRPVLLSRPAPKLARVPVLPPFKV